VSLVIIFYNKVRYIEEIKIDFVHNTVLPHLSDKIL